MVIKPIKTNVLDNPSTPSVQFVVLIDIHNRTVEIAINNQGAIVTGFVTNGSQNCIDCPCCTLSLRKYKTKDAATQIIKSSAPLRYSPQLVIALSSRNPVSMVNQVNIKIEICNKSRGTKIKTVMTKIDIKTIPPPVGFPLAASAVKVNSLPLSLGKNLKNFGRKK